MQIIVYIQSHILDADLGLIHKVVSTLPKTSLTIVGDRAGDYRLLSGLGVRITHSIDDVDFADMLIVLGDEKRTASIDASLKAWLQKISQTAMCVVGLSSGAAYLMQAGVLEGVTFTYPKYHCKPFMKQHQKPQKTRLVNDKKFITTSMPSATLGALYLATEKLYGEHIASTIPFQADIDVQKLCAEDKRLYNGYKAKHAQYIKQLEKNNKKAKYSAVIYLFDDMHSIDVFLTTSILSHLPYQLNFIGNASGGVSLNHFELIADKAIQNFTYSDLLVIGGGESTNQNIVNEYLTYWMSRIAPASYRVLTIGEGEQTLGVSGALRDVNIDVLNELPLGEGKYLMVDDITQAVESLLRIAQSEFGFKRQSYTTYFGITKD